MELEKTAQPQAAAEPQAATENQPFIKVKYLKEEKALTQDQTIQYAQKGMDYDRIRERAEKEAEDHQKTKEKLSQLENNKALKYVTQLAAKNGLSPEDMAARIIDQNRADAEVITIEEARAKRINEEQAQGLASENMTLKQKLDEITETQQKQMKINQELDDFIKARPEVNIHQLPDEVKEQWESGIPLTKAYSQYDKSIQQEKRIKELEAKTANNENAAASTGEIGGGAAPLKEFTREDIDKMSKDELKKYYPQIRKVLFPRR